MRRKVKRVLMLLLVLSMTLTLTACGDLPENIQISLAKSFEARAALNQNIADEIYSSGLISENVYKKITESISKELTDFGASIKSGDEASAKNMLKACVAWRVVPLPPESSGWTSQQITDFHNGFITNVMWQDTNGLSKVATQNAPALGGNGKKILPIEVISESLMNELNQELSVPVYVLKTNVDGAGLDKIIAAVQNASDAKGKSDTAKKYLLDYFEAATYFDEETKSDKPVTLLNPNDPDQQIIRVSSGSPSAPKDFVVDHDMKIDNKDEGVFNFSNGSPGQDMVVSMGGEELMAIRLVEFNQAAINTLKSKIGLSDNRYLVIDGNAYLMEYPVGYIEGFAESEDRQSYDSVIKQSQIGFNLLTCDFTKYAEGSNDSVVVSKDDPYLTYDGATNDNQETQSSLVLYGQTGVSKEGKEIDPNNEPWNLKVGGAEKEVSVGRIVLRDYLEATYAPGVVQGENLIVLGRKLRILQLSGDKSNVVARFYDKDGVMLTSADGVDSAKLFIDDFADIGMLVSSSPKAGYISRLNESLTESASEQDTEESETDTGLDESTAALKSSLSKVSSLDTVVMSQISVSTPFPGKYIGYSDISYTDQKPLFYAMAVRANMFDTGLFSGWVQVTDNTKNSTEWWNKWLGEHGYNYIINYDNLVSFLKGNYAYDLNKEGIVVLDLETIAKIQERFNEEQKHETSLMIRTLFMIIGYALIAYALVLMAAWNMDVHVDLGFSILGKLTFGRWVAIKDYEEMPMMNTDEIIYVNSQQLFYSTFKIIVVGLFLIMVNIIDIILALIQLFGGIADYISKIITGVM